MRLNDTEHAMEVRLEGVDIQPIMYIIDESTGFVSLMYEDKYMSIPKRNGATLTYGDKTVILNDIQFDPNYYEQSVLDCQMATGEQA